MMLWLQRLAPFLPVAAIAFCVAIISLFIYQQNFLYVWILAGAGLAVLLLDLVLFGKKFLVYATVLFVPLSLNTGFESLDFASAFPSEPLVAVLTLIFAMRLLLYQKIERKVLFHPISVLLLFDTVWLIVASTFSTMPIVSIKRIILRVCFLLIFYLLFTQWFKIKKHIQHYFFLYIVGLGVVIFYALNQHSNYQFSANASFAIPQPFFNDHTIYGACIAFVLPFLWLIVFKARHFNFSNSQKWMLRGVLVLFIIAEIISYSRAALLSVLVAIVLYQLLKIRITMFAIITTLLVMGGTVYVFHEELYEVVEANESVSNQGDITSHYSSVTNLQSDASNLERINRWVCAYRMWEDRPWTGFGPGTYQFEYGKYQTFGFKTYISTSHGNRGNAHSEYLTYLSETGLPGFISFVLLVFTTIGIGLRAVYNAVDQRTKYLATAALLGVVTFFFHGVFNSFLDQDKMAVLTFGAMAIIVAIDVFHSCPEIPTPVKEENE